MGYSRDTFYRYKPAAEEGGFNALVEQSRKGRPNLRNRTAPEIEEAIVALATDEPALGQVRVSNELSTDEFDNGLREAMERHGVRVHQRIDGWLVFDEPRAGFDGVLVEAKSGDSQSPHDTIYQLKAYRAALKTPSRQRLLISGITKAPVERREPLPVSPSAVAEPIDHWVFSSADDIGTVLASLGLTASKSGRSPGGRISAGAAFSAPGF